MSSSSLPFHPFKVSATTISSEEVFHSSSTWCNKNAFTWFIWNLDFSSFIWFPWCFSWKRHWTASPFPLFLWQLGFYGLTSFLLQSPQNGLSVTCLYLAMLERIVVNQYLVESAYMLKAKFWLKYPIEVFCRKDTDTEILSTDTEKSSLLAAFQSSKAALIYSLSLVAVNRLNQRAVHILVSPDVKWLLCQNGVYILLKSSDTMLQDHVYFKDVVWVMCLHFACLLHNFEIQPLWVELSCIKVSYWDCNLFRFLKQISLLYMLEADTMLLWSLDVPSRMHCMYVSSCCTLLWVHILHIGLFSLQASAQC